MWGGWAQCTGDYINRTVIRDGGFVVPYLRQHPVSPMPAAPQSAVVSCLTSVSGFANQYVLGGRDIELCDRIER